MEVKLPGGGVRRRLHRLRPGSALAARHPLTSAGKLQLVYHGLDVDRYRPTPHPGRHVPVILSVGRLVEKKGFPILLRAAGILRSRGAEFRLVIIGEGPERADLLSLTTGSGLQDCVEWRGAQSAEQVRAAYAEADVFVLACVIAADGDRDGLPNVLLEALACGVPTVATNVGALPELIEPEQTGLLAQPGDPQDLADQLERMLYDEELRAIVAQLGPRAGRAPLPARPLRGPHGRTPGGAPSMADEPLRERDFPSPEDRDAAGAQMTFFAIVVAAFFFRQVRRHDQGDPAGPLLRRHGGHGRLQGDLQRHHHQPVHGRRQLFRPTYLPEFIKQREEEEEPRLEADRDGVHADLRGPHRHRRRADDLRPARCCGRCGRTWSPTRP